MKKECHSHRTKSNRNSRAESAEVLGNIKQALSLSNGALL
jgi:hypothetical protein